MKNLIEIRDILSKNKEIIEENYNVKKIGIFGSYVRGEEKEDSDLDIIVDFSEPVSLLKLVNFENFLQKITGVKVDVVPEGDIRPELRNNILNEVSYL